MNPFLSPQPPRPARSPRHSSGSQIIASATDGSAISLFTAHADGSVRQWRADGPNTWVEARHYRTIHGPNTLQQLTVAPSFSLPPGTFATGGLDGLAQVHDGAHPPEHPEATTLPGPPCPDKDAAVLALAFAPAQPVLAILYAGEVRLFARAPPPHPTWRLQRCVALPAATGAALSFAPGGKYLFAAGIVLARNAAPWAWTEVATLPGVVEDAAAGNDAGPFGLNPAAQANASMGTLVSAHWAATGFLAVSRALPTSRVLPFGKPLAENGSGFVEVYRLRNGNFSRVATIETDAVVSALEWDRTGTVFAGVAQGILYKFGRTLRDGTWVWDIRDQTSLSEEAA